MKYLEPIPILDDNTEYIRYKLREPIKSSLIKTVNLIKVPDYVSAGWIYDDTKSGDDRFINPADINIDYNN